MTAITKQADFLEGAIQTMLGRFAPSQWARKPFETIFSAIGPVLLWKISWPVGIMAFVGEHFGYGPGYIGKLIDQHLGVGGGKVDLSDENLKAASESVVDEFIKKTQGEQSTAIDAVLDNMIQVKGSLNKEDVLVALYVSKYNKIRKEAIGMPGKEWLKRFFGISKVGIAGVLYGIMKMFAKGILGAAVVGGVASMFGASGKEQAPAPSEPSAQATGHTQYYSNVAKNVEGTLIKFLDATISGFSATFEKIYKTHLQGSKQMQDVLGSVESMNKSSISVMNGWDAFMGPAVLDVAYKLMPVAIYEKINTQEKKQKGVDSKTRLTKLLGEV